MTVGRTDQSALYRCTVCEEDWTYEAIQHVARCRACGGGLLRVAGDGRGRARAGVRAVADLPARRTGGPVLRKD
jgi:DNA-directed RNA polymerase subunit RPC12/RpoP